MKNEQGAILVSALLFLFIITILVISLMHNTLLASKMQYNYQAKIFSLQKAEQNLRNKENLLLTGTMPPETDLIAASCGVSFYRIIAKGDYHNTISEVQSTFAKVGNTSSCDPKPAITTGRQSWREIF